MSRLIDLFAVLAVAVVVLLPKASVEARPALEGESVELDRVGTLQDDLFRDPKDTRAALDLADSFLSSFRSDWAIATLGPFVDREEKGEAKKDARVHLMLATARAERLEAAQAVAEANEAEAACAGGEGTKECPPGTVARARIIGGGMQALVDKKIDPAREPQRAKDEVYKVLHPSRTNIVRPPAK